MAHDALKCERPLVVPVRDEKPRSNTSRFHATCKRSNAEVLAPERRTALKDAAHGARNAKRSAVQLLQEDQR